MSAGAALFVFLVHDGCQPINLKSQCVQPEHQLGHKRGSDGVGKSGRSRCEIGVAATVQDRGPASFADLVDLLEVVALNRVDEDHG